MRVRRILAMLGSAALMVAVLEAPAVAKSDAAHGANAGGNSAEHRADAAAGTTDATAAAAPAAAPAAASTALPDAASATAVEHARRVCAAPQPDFAACHAHVRTKGDGATPDATQGPTGFSATQLRTAYGLTGGAAPLVAIVDAYAHPNAAGDLASYRTAMGLSAATLTQVNQTGGSITTVRSDVGWGQEEMLDLEMVSAICPACPILYVGANSASFADLATAVNRAASLGAKVISNSYGGGESASLTSAYGPAYKHDGVAITVSSGDNGYGVEAPASFNTVTAVGGTHLVLTASGARSSETVWSGAGSGCSNYSSKPSWQNNVTTGCARRMIADVSAVADPNTGVSVYDSFGSSGGNNWFVFGGTSVAAPIIGAVYALSGNTSGTPASLAYSAPAGSLFDVTSGSNGRCTRGKSGVALWCTGGSGYDGPTGMGTPIGTAAF